MKLMHKNLVRFLTLMVLLSIFVSNVFIQQTVKAISPVDISKQVPLKWIVPGSGDQEDVQLVESSVNKYLKDKLNLVLDINTFSWDTFDTKMRALIAAAENFDIGFTSNWTVGYNRIATFNAYKDLTDVLDKYAPKTKELLGENILKGAEVNGRIYALPVYYSGIVNSYGILLNNKYVKKYKIDVTKIKKLQDLEPALKTIKAKESKAIAFYPFNTYSESIVNTLNYDKLALNSPGAVFRDGKSTKVVNEFETTDAKTLFTLMNKWYKAGYIPKSAEASNQYFSDNKSNIFAMYNKITPITRESLLEAYKIDMVPVQLGNTSLNTNSVTSSMHAIPNVSKNPERALMFLELVNTDEKLINLINYGVEGVHYKKTGANAITQLEQGKKSYQPNTTWLFGNETLTYSLPGYSPKARTELNNSVKKATVSPLLSFTFDPEVVTQEISGMNSITQKYLNDLSLGKGNATKTLTKMNSELKKAGLQKVLTEMQKQVDAFKK